MGISTTENINEANVKGWVKTNTKRVNLILDEDFGIFVLNLLEAFLHCRLHPLYEGFKNQRRTPGNTMLDEDIDIDKVQFWNGHCPECMLKGKRVRMKLNHNDFYECEQSGLQLAISCPGVQAVIMNFRGNGKFRSTPTYADTVENGELLFLQTIDKFPYCDSEPINSNVEVKNFIEKIK